MNDAELDGWVNRLRTAGRIMRLGVPIKPTTLPRSRRLRRELELEADNDVRIRTALDAALEAERVRPGVTIRRSFRDNQLRIY